MDMDKGASFQDRIVTAFEQDEPLAIAGGNSKSFLGNKISGQPLSTKEHCGITSYDPRELVVTVRAGTLLSDLETELASQRQMLGFEPPHFGPGATIGGTIASNFSGPRRPYRGAARDFILGTRIINGQGHIMSFGGEVMKNVAGYDVSRLMAGAMGTLGLLLEVSLKVLPVPAASVTLAQEASPQTALKLMSDWSSLPLPLSACCHHGDRLYIRLEGAETAVIAARTKLGGEIIEHGERFWRSIREHKHGFFVTDTPIWRLAVPAATAHIQLPGKWLIDWGGSQRWLVTDALENIVRKEAMASGGHAVLFRRGSAKGSCYHPLEPGIRRIHENLKQSFDPKRILNRDRLYDGL